MKREDIYSEFLKVSRELGLPVKKILDMVFILKDSGSVENNELLRRLGVSRNVLNQVKKLLSAYFTESSSRTSSLVGKLEGFGECFPAGYQTEEDIYKFLETNEFQKIIGILEDLKRPSPRREFDQFIATVETMARRASLLNFMGDVRGKKILFLGDDDFTSVAIASLNSAKEITVLDIDEIILNGIKDASKKIDNHINTFKYDARKAPPSKFVNKFDVVFTDPPYTTAGISLFVSRAISFLDKRNSSARIYVCYGNSDRAKERFLPIYDVFVDSGLMIRWVLDKFNRYIGAESIGGSSTLFICDVTPKTKPEVKGFFNEAIYTLD